jgi:hypothetical protein
MTLAGVAYEQAATAIIQGQVAIMGSAAERLVARVSGLEYLNGTARLTGDGIHVLEALVREFSGVSGPLGARMCFASAQPVLSKHPEIKIPSFSRFQ